MKERKLWFSLCCGRTKIVNASLFNCDRLLYLRVRVGQAGASARRAGEGCRVDAKIEIHRCVSVTTEPWTERSMRHVVAVKHVLRSKVNVPHSGRTRSEAPEAVNKWRGSVVSYIEGVMSVSICNLLQRKTTRSHVGTMKHDLAIAPPQHQSPYTDC